MQRFLTSGFLLIFTLFVANNLQANAQTPRTRFLEPVRISEIPAGIQVTVAANESINDYISQQSDNRFYITIPRAGVSVFDSNLYTGNLVVVRAERRGNDAVFSFNLLRGSIATVKQSYNKLFVFITPSVSTGITNENLKKGVNDGKSATSPSKPQITTETSTSNTATLRIPTVSPNVSKSQMPIDAPVAALPIEKKSEESPAGLPATTNTAESIKSTLRIPRTSRPPTIDDYLSNRTREAETSVVNFRQRSPDDGKSVSQQTKAYLSYDDLNIYVAFVCKDKRERIRAHMAKREDILSDDLVSITLDTFHDRRRAYVFSANPLGIQLDGISTEGQGDDYSFDTLWYSEGRLTEDGYIVLMTIPFKSLRFSDNAEQYWGIALGRTIPHNNEEAYFPYITQRVQGFIQQAGKLEGLENISAGRNVQLIPYYVSSSERALNYDNSGNPFFKSRRNFRAGLDGKIVLRGALTLDLTFNPDFSQVESDEPQVTVNSRYETFFPEKRPFFIENAGFFQTPENIFFSRRIIDPQFGARLTGKTGKWAFGGLIIDDRAPGRFFFENEEDYGKRAVAGVFRVQRELGEQSSVGFLVTNYNFGSSANRVLSFDTRIKLNQNWSFTGQVMQSLTKELDGTKLSGPAYLASLTRSGRHFNYDLTYTDRSPNFRSTLGFIPRTDIRQVEQYASYRWRPNKRGIASFGPSGYAMVNWNRRGQMQDWYANAGFNVEFTGLTTIEFKHSESYELFLDKGFRTGDTGISFYSDRLSWLGVSGSYNWGGSINYFPAPGLEPFRANSKNANIGLNFRPSTRFRFEQTYIYNRLSTSFDPSLSGNHSKASIFNNHIMRSKLNYQFNRELSLRAIFDYNAVLPNSALVNLEREKRLTTDFLLTYLLNPGTALYIGYTDNYENLTLVPGTPSTLLRTGMPTTSTGSRLFVKISNLFRY
ncbi:MAG TPA: DUF5916 domain-containing protein [Pyrinomonadaceae bacterium]